MTDNVIWHGPAIGQNIKGLENMRKAWNNSPNNLEFSVGSIEAQCIQTSAYSCEVMLMFVVTTYYPNGDEIPIFQRVQFSWADVNVVDEQKRRTRIPKIFMIHISDPIEQHNDDFIYPIHYNQLYKQAAKPVQEPRLSLRGTDNAFYVVTVSSIIWAESTPEHHCLVHLIDRTLKAKTTVTQIEKQTKGFLVRVHSGYIVNPNHVVSVWRFKASMSDGSVIPIPEKRYTSVKKMLLSYTLST